MLRNLEKTIREVLLACIRFDYQNVQRQNSDSVPGFLTTQGIC